MKKVSIGRKVTGMVASGFVASIVALSSGTPVASAAAVVLAVMPAQIQDIAAPVIPNNATINQTQNWLESAIDGRVQDLAALSTLVAASPKAVASDKVALNAAINAASNGLTTLEVNSSDDNTLKQLRIDASNMVLNYRVYSFVDPMVRAVVSVDLQSAVVQADVVLEPGIKAALAASQLSNKATNTANADLLDLISVLNDATTQLSGLSLSFETMNASNYPGTITAIAIAKPAVSAAQDDVTEANSDLTQIVKLLTNASLTSHLKGSGAVRALIRHLAVR